MIKTKAYAAQSANVPLTPFEFERRPVGDHDILIEILYCGVCHTDIHAVRNDWGGTMYPIVPGHEIIGRVIQTGKAVTRFKINDISGAGYLYDSCRHCYQCAHDAEQYCENGITPIMGGQERETGAPLYGGYASKLVIDERYAVKVPAALPLAAAAPLLCAGITTYSPLKYIKAGPGHKIGIAGLGGLGHMAVKFAKALGAEVTVLSTSTAKEQDAEKLGADHFVWLSDLEAIKTLYGHFDFIIDTISAPHDYNIYVNLLKVNGSLILVGLPGTPLQLDVSGLIFKRRSISGSLIGSIHETQEMLEFCAEKNIVADIEIIPVSRINEAYERMIKGDIKYRFVIDMATL
ncbi:NAD(P)-dependent alcohol dehydrogenase [Chitinophaga vietnamensis]|uniref:NAD(P)-dependent alcohol dehydrogenase n=1 Tax=Chitinophaga vietnamensis TaxID=2593957 RepID=UPI001177A241|nr:NAD(P)-dependent alcohol dehydrogenase [Chitinophaga vietnamensis]